jgi:hypothetical protein
MWVIISTSNDLKFYCFKRKEFIQHFNLNYRIDNGYTVTNEIDNHNFVVKQLIAMGYPIFINKKEARKQAVFEKLTGFKYLKLSPTIISSIDFED